ncbi:unnamed protein product [Caenorhabditis bovis]|uniref:T20D4.11-like domain-containing protein n=1 Tax=Caenorhabditis bovis TaxID=2654633 RepID=A0A8S1EGF5_9PELO|nr:unnamed protein product [Caenorhabditis bovis]
MRLLIVSVLIVIAAFALTVDARRWHYPLQWKENCTEWGKQKAYFCFIYPMKQTWRLIKYGLFVDNSALTVQDMKDGCMELIDCFNKTDCYLDGDLYLRLDNCIKEMHDVGPFKPCFNKIDDFYYEHPQEKTECIANFLEKEKRGCVELERELNCVLPAVERSCEAKHVDYFKEYQALRLYNMGCTDMLKYERIE